MIKYYVGIDPAPTSTGICIRTSRGVKLLAAIGGKGVDKSNEFDKMCNLIDTSEKIIRAIFNVTKSKHDIVVGIECPLPSAARNNTTWSVQQRFYAILYTLLINHYINNQNANSFSMYAITPAEGKLAIGGKRTSTKDEIIELATNKDVDFTGLKQKRSREDCADAYAISLAVEMKEIK